ncbi:DUF7793 family protein [Arthrobacter sp. TMS1-12-1]
MDQFEVNRTEDVLYLRWRAGVQITHPVAVDAAHALAEISGPELLPLIVVMGGIDGLTFRTRVGMNSYRGFSRVALIGDGPVDEVMAGFAVNSLTPTRYFTSETEALSWIKERQSTAEDGPAA